MREKCVECGGRLKDHFGFYSTIAEYNVQDDTGLCPKCQVDYYDTNHMDDLDFEIQVADQVAAVLADMFEVFVEESEVPGVPDMYKYHREREFRYGLDSGGFILIRYMLDESALVEVTLHAHAEDDWYTYWIIKNPHRLLKRALDFDVVLEVVRSHDCPLVACKDTAQNHEYGVVACYTRGDATDYENNQS